MYNTKYHLDTCEIRYNVDEMSPIFFGLHDKGFTPTEGGQAACWDGGAGVSLAQEEESNQPGSAEPQFVPFNNCLGLDHLMFAKFIM